MSKDHAELVGSCREARDELRILGRLASKRGLQLLFACSHRESPIYLLPQFIVKCRDTTLPDCYHTAEAVVILKPERRLHLAIASPLDAELCQPLLPCSERTSKLQSIGTTLFKLILQLSHPLGQGHVRLEVEATILYVDGRAPPLAQLRHGLPPGLQLGLLLDELVFSRREFTPQLLQQFHWLRRLLIFRMIALAHGMIRNDIQQNLKLDFGC